MIQHLTCLTIKKRNFSPNKYCSSFVSNVVSYNAWCGVFCICISHYKALGGKFSIDKSVSILLNCTLAKRNSFWVTKCFLFLFAIFYYVSTGIEAETTTTTLSKAPFLHFKDHQMFLINWCFCTLNRFIDGFYHLFLNLFIYTYTHFFWCFVF